MIKISREEVKKIADMSRLYLAEEEIDPMIKALEDVLSYAERVSEISVDVGCPSNKNINIFREDIQLKSESDEILTQAPEKEDDFFVVPVIIEK